MITLILILLRTIVYACLVAIPYFLYQLLRNEAVYKIRIKWIDQSDYERWNKYSYDDMLDPSKHNWFGLKYPKDSHFK